MTIRFNMVANISYGTERFSPTSGVAKRYRV